MRAIYKRELASCFNGMTGPVCVAFMLAAVGLYFMVINLFQGYPSFSAALNAALFLFLAVIPILTMRSMAEDRRSRTDQLLLTAPVSVTRVVLGKFFALWTVFSLPCIVFALCPLVLRLAAGSGGTVYFAADYATLLAFWLLGGLYISIGVLISSTTESQLLAAVGTFAVLLVLFLWEGILSLFPAGALSNLVGCLLLVTGLALALNALSGSHWLALAAGGVGAVGLVAAYLVRSSLFEGLLAKALGLFSLGEVIAAFAVQQVFDLTGLLLYLSLTVLCLFLTVQMVQRRRWS